jgi:D-3-phosphoglycerate dehydrogenase / 2-oxoglutarate reductase
MSNVRKKQLDNRLRPFQVALIETSETAKAVPAWVRDALAAEEIEFTARGCETRADLEAYASGSDLVWVWGSSVVTADRLNVLAKCGALLRSGSGTDNIPVAEATKHRMVVINTPDAVAQEVADHAIGLLLALVRQIAAQDRLIRSGKWEFRRENNRWHLRGSTLGLLGFGRIAELVSEKMRPFGLRMLAYDPWVPATHIQSKGAEPVTLPTLLSQSDFLTVHCPLTTETRHLIGEKEIAQMKSHAIIINTSRGPIIHEEALVRALQEKRIGGAGLDVFEQEPLPASSPLLAMENAVLTPHIAGYSDLYPESFWRYSVESVIAIANGYWPRSVVNPGVEPKWQLRRRNWTPDPEGYQAEKNGAEIARKVRRHENHGRTDGRTEPGAD